MNTAAANLKPDHLLHELAELWTTMSKQEAGAPSSSGVLRACAMTLTVFVDDEADSMALGETLAQLMRAHPSRAIVVRLREDAGVLESRVFAQCWMPFGHNRQICCEQVEFSVSVNRMVDIPSIVSPLAAPDVPRVVWFRSTRMENVPNIAELLALGDKIIVDSRSPGAPAFADLRVLCGAGWIVGDLAWTSLTRLRELIAQLLDGRDLKSIGNVVIEYSGTEAPPGVKYLQAWLRAELPAAEVELARSNATGKPRLDAIRIPPDIHIRAGKHCAEYETGGLRQRANLPECAESELLSEELNIMTHDRIFEKALQRMTAWTPEILIFNTAKEAADACGERTLEILLQARKDRGAATLAASGGSTPRLMFEAMTKHAFDWTGVELFQVDERCVPPDHSQSNFRMLQETLLSGGGIEDRRVHRIQGELAPGDAAHLYVEEIRRVFQVSQTTELPAFDVIQRGMGPDAHTASLFPNDPIIEDRTGIAAAVENPALEKSMRHRVTLLRGVLENARHTLCLVTGEDKAEALWKVLRTPFHPVLLPAQIASANTVWFLDKAAAARL